MEDLNLNTEQEVTMQSKFIEKVKEINNDKKLKYSILTMGCQLNEMIQKNFVVC